MPTDPDLATALAPILDIAEAGAEAMFGSPREREPGAAVIRARLIDALLGLPPAPVDVRAAQTVRAVLDPDTIDALLEVAQLPAPLRTPAAEAVWQAH